MKLRQKLAAVLATAMVVTAVPVVTMADSTNKVVKSTAIVEKGTKTTSGALRIKFDDYAGKEEFYLTLTNAKWLKSSDEAIIKGDDTTVTMGSEGVWTYSLEGVGIAKYTRQSNTVMKVEFTADASYTDAPKAVQLPLPVELTGGTATVAITGEGSDTTITEGTYTFASTGEDAATVQVGTAKSFYDAGELSTIILKETFVGSLVQPIVLKVELNDTDFEFTKASNNSIKVEGTYGFSDKTPSVKLAIDKDDKSTAYIQISGLTKGNSLGRLEISGLKVSNGEKEIEVGDLLADVKAVTSVNVDDIITGETVTLTGTGELEKTYSNLVLAKIANYGAYIQMKDEKAVDIVAGRDEEVEFTVSETVDDCFVGGRKIEITLDSDEYDDAYFWIKNDNAAIQSLISKDEREIVENVEVVWHKDEAPKANEYGKVDTIIVELKGEDKDNKKLNANEKTDAFKVKTTIYVPIDQKDKKELTLVASMRGVDEFKSATAVNVINPFDVTFDQTTLKVGLQNQVAGKITITEKDKEMFGKGEIVLDIVKGSKVVDGIVIEEAGDLSVTGDLKKADLDTVEGNDKANKITLKRQSKAASTLTVENMEITVDRTVPEGTYNLEISGDAIDIHGGKLKVEDYIVIGTPNTQDITASNGLAKGTATFTIGANQYTLNGEEKTMDAAAYIQDPGYTMVPVRYVAQAFGVAETDIMFGKGTVTIFAGTRTVQLTNGSEIAVVNGANVAMSTKVVIKDGRTYAPIGEIAKILGVSSTWDNTTKTATFTNK